jgi:succinyl-diaminopimelate desuccinylase
VDPLADRTLELVDIPSVSREEATIVDHVRAVMPGRPVYDDDTVLFYPGRIVLAGHYDTVPAQGNLPGRIEDGWVVGLGSTDMKGGVAVMIELARAGAGFGYLFFGREELPAGESALPRFFERHGLDADLVVMLEPTDDSIHAGCLGNIDARLVFHGTSAHSARPWMGDNAIDHAVRGLSSIVGLPPMDVEIQGLVFREVLSVTGIEGGIASNVIPDRAVATLNFRYAPNRTPEEGAARLRELVGASMRGLPEGTKTELEILGNSPSAHVAVDSPLVQALCAAGGYGVHPKQAWTPVAEFAQQGLDAVNLGPGATRYAHKRDERVEIASLRRTYDALLRFVDTVTR